GPRVRRLAGLGAAAEFNRRKNPAGRDHQARQPLFAPAADQWGKRQSAAIEGDQGRSVGDRYSQAAAAAGRSCGAGEQDAAHRLGGDAAPEGIPAQGRGGLVVHGTSAGACERAMTRDGTVGRSDATERSLPFHWDIDPARMMRPRFADSIRASSPLGLREQAVKEVEPIAGALGLTYRVLQVHGLADCEPSFASMRAWPADAVLVLDDATFIASRAAMAAAAARHRLPLICGPREMAEAGCLFSYSASIKDMWYRSASFVDKILKGA